MVSSWSCWMPVTGSWASCLTTAAVAAVDCEQLLDTAEGARADTSSRQPRGDSNRIVNILSGNIFLKYNIVSCKIYFLEAKEIK